MRETAQDALASYRQTNTAGTLQLAQQARAARVGRFVLVSSIKVNGEATLPGQPFSAHSLPAPLDPYGVSKWEAEHGLAQLAGLETVVVRPPLVYGPGVGANFRAMMAWLKKGVPLPLGAVSQNRRSLVALDNLVDLLILCAHHPAAPGQTFLVSDGEDVSTRELLRRMAAALGVPARLLPVPCGVLQLGAQLLSKGAMAQRLLDSLQVDMQYTQQTLNWSPPLSLDEGLLRAVTN